MLMLNLQVQVVPASPPSDIYNDTQVPQVQQVQVLLQVVVLMSDFYDNTALEALPQKLMDLYQNGFNIFPVVLGHGYQRAALPDGVMPLRVTEMKDCDPVAQELANGICMVSGGGGSLHRHLYGE